MIARKIIATVCASVTIIGSTAVLPQNTFDSFLNSTSVVAVDTDLAQVVLKENYTCTSNAIRLKWNTVEGASGYRIYRYDPTLKKLVKIATVIGTNTFRDSGLESGTIYKYRVKAYKVSDGKTTVGKESATFNGATKPKKVTLTTYTKTTNAIRINWKSVKCNGYKIYQLKDNKWYEVGSTDSNTTTLRIPNLTADTSYNFMVTAYSTDLNGLKNYSVYSTPLTAKTKAVDVVAVDEAITMPSNVTVKVGEPITIKADTNVGGFLVKNVVLSSDTPNISYSYTYSGDTVTFKLDKACTAKFRIVLKSPKGTRAVCVTNITATA